MIETSSNNSMAVAFVAAIIIVVILAFSINGLFVPPTPVITMTNVSLNPSSTTAGHPVTLTLSLKNNDKSNSHFVLIQFESYTLVTFMLGNQQLPTQNGAFSFTTTMNAGSQLTQPFIVQASLENGIAQLSYQITIKLYVDGNQINEKNLTLPVSAQ